MTLPDFHNALRILFSIDMHELEEAGVIAAGDHAAWNDFRAAPARWLIRADDEQAQKLWQIVQRRMRR